VCPLLWASLNKPPVPSPDLSMTATTTAPHMQLNVRMRMQQHEVPSAKEMKSITLELSATAA